MSQRLRNLLWILLLPISFGWAGVTYLRRRFYPRAFRHRAHGKVICIGNIHSGGSGKTPLVREVLSHFKEQNPVVLSRGYRGRLSKTGAWIDKNANEGAVLYGDEPWMLAHQTSSPIYIGKKRVQGIREIETKFPHAFTILDDGFQHLALVRDLDLICINTDKTIADNFCLPLGDLREPISALKEASAIVLIPGLSAQQKQFWLHLLKQEFSEIPLFEARKAVDGLWEAEERVDTGSEGVWFGFCGIAEPQRFIYDFTQAFPQGKFLKAYADHERYEMADIEWLADQCRSAGASGLVTTDKDWYKVKDRFRQVGERVVSLRIRYELPSSFWRFLREGLDRS